MVENSSAIWRGLDEPAAEMLATSREMFAITARSLSELTQQVTIQQFRTLVLLSEEGPCRIGDIAEDLGVSSSTATRSVGRILRQGWIRRRPDLGSQRETYVALTPDGASLVDGVMSSRLEQIRAILTHLTDAERASALQGFALFNRAATRSVRHSPVDH
jgi:DNA-binding MarR family transcriptional regulator